MSPPSFQRLGPLSRLPGLLASHGIAPGAVFGPIGLDAGDCGPDTAVPLRAAAVLLRRAEALTGTPALGAELGIACTGEELGRVWTVMRTASTFGQALEDLVEWQLLFTTGATTFLVRGRDTAMLAYGVHDPASPPNHILYETAAGFACAVTRTLTGGKVAPLEIHLMTPRPPNAAVYERAFGAPVRFNQDQTCLLFDAAALDAPLAWTVEAGERERARAALAGACGDEPGPLDARVRIALRSLIRQGRANRSEVARALGLHPRTLVRRLGEADTSFEQIRDEVRWIMACELLALTNLSTSDIAIALSFSEQSAFARAFRTWSGEPPVTWRRHCRSHPAAMHHAPAAGPA